MSKEEFKSRLVKYLVDKVQNWKKMTGLGFCVEEMIETDANYRLYNIDEKKYGKVLSTFDQKLY